MTQPFLSFGDGNWYTLAPGESANNFLGTGWTLSGGAKIVSTTLYNGTKGYVLDLPPTGKAVSPAVCVTSDYPTARAMIRNGLLGGGVKTSVAYTGFAGWGPAMSTGVIRSPLLAWSLSVPMNIRPSFSPGWQLAQFTFAGTSGLLTDYQIYNFYVDPRMH